MHGHLPTDMEQIAILGATVGPGIRFYQAHAEQVSSDQVRCSSGSKQAKAIQVGSGQVRRCSRSNEAAEVGGNGDSQW